MGMRGRKRRDRRKKAANHGKRPNTWSSAPAPTVPGFCIYT